MRADHSLSAERAEKSMTGGPASDGPARSLASRAISRRQALGLAGGALAGVAALASMPKAASAARVASSSAVLESLSDVPPPLTLYNQGNFGRLFPQLPAFASDSPEVRKNLLELGKVKGIMDAQDPPPPANPLLPRPDDPRGEKNPNNPDHTAGLTFLGQFLDHDVTFDPTSSLLSQVDPTTVANFRTPAFELDSVYGSGRRANPHLYDQTSPDGIKLLIDEEAPKDVPRNSQNIAITGDPRNDENLIVSQLHLAFFEVPQRGRRWIGRRESQHGLQRRPAAGPLALPVDNPQRVSAEDGGSGAGGRRSGEGVPVLQVWRPTLHPGRVLGSRVQVRPQPGPSGLHSQL
jgi:hypothetical protein